MAKDNKPPMMGLVQSINGARPSNQRTSQNPEYPAERLAGLSGPATAGPPLAPDEESVLVRVRLPKEPAAWWLSLTAQERGAIITAVFGAAKEGEQ